MWKKVNGQLIHTTDTSRVKFRTNISKRTLDHLESLAKQYNTHINYLIENGLENLISVGYISYNKKMRPKDRIQYKTTYNDKLLARVKVFAIQNELNINDIIECSVDHINLETIKDRHYKHRVE
ncbi:hypothetical protein [Paucisalibacillus globulus]|uniref:hypothetical protein n=1 Tax=Paucisalibacillus globulus TaxID=351095 RepID=UPI00040D136C|nr:hypothetical protein [Paucisalibacillus globulus]